MKAQLASDNIITNHFTSTTTTKGTQKIIPAWCSVGYYKLCQNVLCCVILKMQLLYFLSLSRNNYTTHIQQPNNKLSTFSWMDFNLLLEKQGPVRSLKKKK